MYSHRALRLISRVSAAARVLGGTVRGPAIAAAIALLAFLTTAPAAGATSLPLAAGPSLTRGIDVAPEQTNINWQAVRNAGYRFAYVKAKEGTYTNSAFWQQYNGARAAGIYRGAYYFASPFFGSGTTHATQFLDLISYQKDGWTLPPALDVEFNKYLGEGPCDGADQTAWQAYIRNFATTVKARTGRDLVVYVWRWIDNHPGMDFWRDCVGGTTAFARSVNLWIADWGAAQPALLGGWSTYTFWQYGAGAIPGAAHPNPDLDYFNGSPAQLRAYVQGSTQPPTPRPTPSGVPGIDVSKYQGQVDWKTLHDRGYQFAYVSAGDGTMANPLFDAQYRGAREAGLYRGAYFFAEPAFLSGADDARRFLDQIHFDRNDPMSLPPVLSVEQNPNLGACDGVPQATWQEYIKEFTQLVEQQTGRAAVIYVHGADFWNSCVGGAGRLAAGHPLWLGDWEDARPALPQGWQAYTFWQWRIVDNVPGVHGSVLQGVFNGTPDQLKRFACAC